MTCCAARILNADPRFEPKPGPTSERVMQCRACGALWVEEWSVRVGYDGQDDRDVVEHRRVTLAEATARFEPAVR
jgi:hypothetical protein